jgi:hypothetical protein
MVALPILLEVLSKHRGHALLVDRALQVIMNLAAWAPNKVRCYVCEVATVAVAVHGDGPNPT